MPAADRSLEDLSRTLANPTTSVLSCGFSPVRGDGVGERLGARVNGFGAARGRMVARLERCGVRDARVLEAMNAVPRHRLVPEALHAQAYHDVALPLGDGQTISAPPVVAVMSQALELTGGETVLEIGTGSGYQAAILSRLAARVISIERIPKLAARARSALDELGVTNVVVHLGDGSEGRAADAPYDAIVVTAGGPVVPQPLLAQLKPGGRLVGPFGPRGAQRLLRVRAPVDGRERAPAYGRESARADARLRHEVLGICDFVDLRGAHGWSR